MSETIINLFFRGPFGLAGEHDRILFREPEAKLRGIYLFAVPYMRGGFLVTYVGETGTSFGQRAKEHMIQTLGGNYRISDPDQLSYGSDIVLWNGLWRKDTRDRIEEYIDRLPELMPAIQRGLRMQVLFAAELDVDTRKRQRIESALAEHIRRQAHPAGSVLPVDIRYRPRKDHESEIGVIVECSRQIHGLPKELKA